MMIILHNWPYKYLALFSYKDLASGRRRFFDEWYGLDYTRTRAHSGAGGRSKERLDQSGLSFWQAGLIARTLLRRTCHIQSG